MLEQPDIKDEKIVDCLQRDFGLNVVQVAFLPLGADRNTAVYRAVTDGARPYFVKLRRGVFDETTVAVPKFLHDQGIKQIIAPMPSRSQQLWASLGSFNVTVYPFVEGKSGFETGLTEDHWADFGRALKAVHGAAVPPALAARIQQETFSPQWRELVRSFQAQVETTTFREPVAAELAAYMKVKRGVIGDLVNRAARLSTALRTQSLEIVLCHSDVHAANILISTSGDLYIVDWDNPILAPKERDLMFIGAGICTPPNDYLANEEELFYRGYGQIQVDPVALAYYRYERIVQDIAAYCEQLLLTDEGGADRKEGLRQLTSQFLPNDVIDIAYRSEKDLPLELQAKSS
jgi:spectinomycin phosphotransferase